MKWYLVTTTTIDGEHEYRHTDLIEARSGSFAERKVEKLLKRDDCGLDAKDSYFGFGDGQTATKLNGVREISESFAKMLTFHGVCSELRN